jgi:glutathione synthase
MGGKSIFKVSANDPNRQVILETLTENQQHPIMAQRFIKEVSEGDKRILLIDGEPIDYALVRLPKQGEHRANLAAGAKAVGAPLTDRDRWICNEIAPTLREKGLLFVGIDVIGDYLTEINVTSPTCIRELDKLYQLNISADLLDAIEKKLKNRQ